jgi:hypothetical protein
MIEGGAMRCSFAVLTAYGYYGTIAIDVNNSVRPSPYRQWTSTELLSFANYVRRVEIEIERMKHEDRFLDGSTVCDRHEAIERALDGVDEDDEDEFEVNIVPTSRVYPGECVDLEELGERIAECCHTDDDCNLPEVRWKDGASEALSVFLDTYADLDPWYNGEDEESVTVRLVRDESGHAVDWEEVECPTN